MIDIHPLFSNPVMVSTPNGAIRPFTNVIDYCKTLKYNLNLGQNWASDNTDVLSLPIFTEIQELIENAIGYYTSRVMMWDSNKFYITQSWVNVTPPGTEHHPHYHSNSILSGTFYLQTLNDDHIVFRTDHKPLLSFQRSSYNIWNSDSWKLQVSDNAIVIFPSHMFHSVEQNTANIERVSIAFNVFVQGDLGVKENLTYLKL